MTQKVGEEGFAQGQTGAVSANFCPHLPINLQYNIEQLFFQLPKILLRRQEVR